MGNPVVSKKAFGSSKRPKARKNNHHERENLAYFRLLGLRSGESRVEVIRDAALAMSIGLSRESQRDGTLQQRHEIAVATYRLLDPRRRRRLVERIQLCYPIDRDEASVPPPHFHVSGVSERQLARDSRDAEVIVVLVESRESEGSDELSDEKGTKDSDSDESHLTGYKSVDRGTVADAKPTFRGVALMQQPVIDRAIDEVLLAPTAITSRSDSESWMDERREIVRSLKKYDTEESRLAPPQTSSTLTWLRSVFGL